jgi:branched-chain amino acid transport system substrate-binding protein
MKRVGNTVRFAIVAVLGVAAVFAASIATAAAPKTLTIGILDSMTGLSSEACLAELEGMKLAVAEAGHIRETVAGKKVPYLRGVPVKLNPQDDQSTAAGAVTGFRSVVDSGDLAIVGPCSSVVATAIAPLIDAAKLPVVYSTAGSDGIIDPQYAFRGGMPMAYFTGRVVQVMKGKGITRVYALYASDNPVYLNIYGAMKKTMKVLGMDVVGDFATTSRTIDYGAAVQQINQLKPDAVAVLVRSSQVPPAITQIRNGGITLPLFGSGNWPSVQHAGPMMTGGIYATNYADVFPYAASRRFTNEFRTKTNGDPGAQAANGYDAMWRVLRAIHDADPTKVAAATTAQARVLIQKQLAAQKTGSGAQGALTYTSLGDTKGPAGVVQIIDDTGKLKLLPVPTVSSLLGKKK